MAKYLVIVESPTKVKTIKKFLGPNYQVAATNGHVRDLPKSSLGIDIEHNYEPKYITIRGKGDVLANLRREVKKAEKIYLATDPDREGEAISWHLLYALKLEDKRVYRITFNEITKNAVKESLKNAREINMNLVDAQQARRLLDRMVGYRISPLLWNKIKRGLSAGRVQSVALRIICDREEEINAFVPEEYWTLEACLKVKGEKKPIRAKYYGTVEEKKGIADREEAERIMAALKDAEFTVKEVRQGERVKKQPLPFTTSTLQQEANKAAEKTDTAKSKKEGTKAAANTASAKAAASFNIKNQYQKEVESAQREYNSAQAEQNEDKGLIGKAVDAVKGFLSKLADAVSNAVDKLRGAEKQYEEDKADEEKKWALDEEAQVQLEEKQKEQDKASEISKQAQIILDRKTGEREVSDQEYADALLDLADAVMEQDEASGEYDSALEAVLEANENWQVQNGKITNANGKVVSCTEVCKELEKFVTDKIKEKSDTEASYDKVLKTTAGAIKGDKDKINSLGKQIKALEKDIKEQEKKIALQEQMAAQITAEKSTLDAKKDSEGIGDSIKRLFGFGNAKDKKSFDTKQEALQEAISTGTAKNISKAYKAIYGSS